MEERKSLYTSLSAFSRTFSGVFCFVLFCFVLFCFVLFLHRVLHIMSPALPLPLLLS